MTTETKTEESAKTRTPKIEIRYVGSTDAIYDDSPLETTLRLSPNQTIFVTAAQLPWFMNQNKEYTSCCGAAGTHMRKRFEVVQ